MSRAEIVICNPVRTAIGTYGGSLKDTPAPALGAAVIRDTLKRSGLAPEALDTVVMGNVIQAGTRMNPARQAAIGGGVPVAVPALTVNRVCGSGAQAIVSAALEIRAGYATVAIAGGMENMDQAPYLVPGAAGATAWANSGAAAMIVAERRFAEKQGLEPLARLVSHGIAAVEPGMFGIGPVPAVRLALARASWEITAVECVEINEAFAALALEAL